MMRKLLLAVLLAILIGVSGCVQAEKKQEAKEILQEENKTVQEQPKEVSKEPEKPKVPTLANELLVGPGRSSTLAGRGGLLYIAYQRFTGVSEDVHYATYSGGKVSKAQPIATTDLNEISPSLTVFNGKVYLFYTKAAVGLQQSSTIYFKDFDGTKWSEEKKGPDIYDIWYPHNQTALSYNKKLLFFWTRGRPNERGAIGTQYYDEGTWIDGIKVSVENVNEKNPKVNSSTAGMHMIYEGYAPNAESNEVYYRLYDGFEWSGAEKISESVKTSLKGSGSIANFKDKIYALWFAGGAIYLSIKEGATWGNPIKLTGGDSFDEPALAEYEGKLYVSYTKIQENGAPFVYLTELQGI